MKSYADLEQSKKLAEILPLESADMHYWLAWSGGISEEKRNTPKVGKPRKYAIKTYWCPCWSLAALLGVLPNENILVKTTDGEYYCLAKDVMTRHYDNSIAACYEFILKLHELNLL